jgi:hypothetical protein
MDLDHFKTVNDASATRSRRFLKTGGGVRVIGTVIRDTASRPYRREDRHILPNPSWKKASGWRGHSFQSEASSCRGRDVWIIDRQPLESADNPPSAAAIKKTIHPASLYEASQGKKVRNRFVPPRPHALLILEEGPSCRNRLSRSERRTPMPVPNWFNIRGGG